MRFLEKCTILYMNIPIRNHCLVKNPELWFPYHILYVIIVNHIMSVFFKGKKNLYSFLKQTKSVSFPYKINCKSVHTLVVWCFCTVDIWSRTLFPPPPCSVLYKIKNSLVVFTAMSDLILLFVLIFLIITTHLLVGSRADFWLMSNPQNWEPGKCWDNLHCFIPIVKNNWPWELWTKCVWLNFNFSHAFHSYKNSTSRHL